MNRNTRTNIAQIIRPNKWVNSWKYLYFGEGYTTDLLVNGFATRKEAVEALTAEHPTVIILNKREYHNAMLLNTYRGDNS